MDVKLFQKFKGKRVIIFLKNHYKYEGELLEIVSLGKDLDFLEINDIIEGDKLINLRQLDQLKLVEN